MAATLGESKIPKSFASTAKIQVLCKNIEQPAAPFALRLSAALMLGVVRVFSRKSAIVLLDVNSIMQRLKRFQTRQERNNRGKKGYKEMSNGISLHTGEISLKEGDDVARFDSITLPISKRRRSRTYALPMLKTVQASNMRGKSLWDNQSKSSVHMGDASVGESNEVDVLQAMETLFPSVQVPRLGETLQSGLNSPNSANKPEEQKKLLYRAREQDITLSAPTAMLDNMAFDMFDEDLPVVGPPGPSLDVGNLEELWMQDLGNAEEVANAFGSASQGSSRSKLGKSNESRYMLPPIEPFEPEAHHMDILPIEEQEILPPPPPLLMEKKTKLRSVHSSPVKESTKGPEYGKNISTGTGGSKSSLKRLRRSGLLCIDDETELSPSQIRAYLNDTSDIVIPEHEPRPKGKKNRKKVTQEVSYGFPQLLSCFPNVIQEFWNEVAPEELLMAGAVPCDSHSNEGPAHPSLSGSNVSKDAENPSRCPVPAQLPEKQAVPNVEPAVPLLEELPSEIPMYLNEEDQILPNIVPNPTSVTGREGEDVEVQRGAGSNAVRTPGHLSMHSHSLGDRSISVSQPSGRAYSLRSLEAVRDRLFEEVCL